MAVLTLVKLKVAWQVMMLIVNVACNISLFIIDSGLSGGAIAGIVIGVMIAIFVALPALCICLWKKNKCKREDPERKPLQDKPEKD